MNYRMVLFIVGQIFKAVGAFMFLPVIVGLIYGEHEVWYTFGIPIFILFAAGFCGNFQEA